MTYIKKEVWVDYMRVIATFCVVLLHSAAPLLYEFKELPLKNWWIANIYDSTVRISVPLFFMLSGYLLLEKNEEVKVFLKKRFNKVAVPLLAWSIIYIFWKIYIESKAQLSIRAFYSIVISPAYYHLWFLYAIIGLYLFIPILRVVVKNADRKLLHYYLVVWFFAVGFIPYIEKLIDLNNRLDLLSVSGFSGYLILGLLLGKYQGSTKSTIVSAAVLLACTCVTFVGTYLITIWKEGVFYGYLYDYLSPNVILASAAAFMLIRNLIENNELFHRPVILSVVKSLSSASLGIYLVHAIFLYLLSAGDIGFTLDGFTGNPVYSIPATALVVFLLSYIVVVVIKRIPVLNRIVP